MYKIILFLTLPLLFILSCKESTKQTPVVSAVDDFLKDFKEGESIGGYPYVHHVNKKGQRPKEGAMISYHQVIQVGDSTIFSTRKLNNPKEALLPSSKNYPSPPPPDYIALRIMSEGDSLSIYQPLSTIPMGKLPPNMNQGDTIVHHLKLLSVKQPDQLKKEIEAVRALQKEKQTLVIRFIDQYKAGALKGKLTKTASGLEYIVIKKSAGEKPEKGQFIKVHYSGALSAENKPFDNTYADGRPYRFQFGEGRVIKGWDEGIGYLNEGEQAIFFIPYTLGYGAEGRKPSIPGKAKLAFFVELVEIL